jgi:3-phosphoshikimate 1-carboxyvinyltransferase
MIIQIPASKSISNRLLILQYLFPQIQIDNLSTAKDTQVLKQALHQICNSGKIDVGHAGTSMRFLTALLSIQEGKTFVLDGSTRMRQRPISILVAALRQLGANIQYIEKEGYPPLQITGKKLLKKKINIQAGVSSQYISALLLIAPALPDGLILQLNGNIVSSPYIDMTVRILQKIGVPVRMTNNFISVSPLKQLVQPYFFVESDWSSASYFYSAMAVMKSTGISLEFYLENSWQGDRKLKDIFKKFGVITQFDKQKLILKHIPDFILPDKLSFHLIDQPDLAQTIAVTCLALGIRCKITGLQTLRIKETDRLQALQTEMQKLGAEVIITTDSLSLTKPEISNTKVSIATYDDHRMAMSFAVLQKIYPEIIIENKDVVVKSFPDFWEKFGLLI